VRLEL